ncbi:MAG: hypothetical protein IH624_18790 [Phycisphaerae bacterium]|nr:hypothetical protein [Phycisphaerae bacterium]
MRLKSLKIRIRICIAVLTTAVVTVLSGVAYHEFRESLWRNLDVTLQSDLQQIRSLLLTNVADDEMEREIHSFLNPKGAFQKIDYQVWVENTVDNEMHPLITSDIYDALARQKIAPPSPGDFILADLERHNKTYRVIWAAYTNPDDVSQTASRLNIALALSSEHAYSEVGEFVRVLVIASAIVIWAAFGLTHRILRWGLIPIDSLAERMNQITQENLNAIKQEDDRIHQELRPFVKSWEAMLARLADAMNEQKRFIADAAHELKTPVTLLKSTLQLAHSRKRTTDYYEETISNALEDIERLNSLIGQLLHLSRLENREGIDQWETLGVDEILEDVIESYKPLWQEKEFILDRRLHHAEINGNAFQMRQLFGNLIDNAIKFAPPRTTITVAVQVEHSRVAVRIQDEGGSIPEQECQLLFNRFYRVSKARDRDSGGSGLGLAIAQGIAKLHAGSITVTSNRQDGTTFVVVLPLSDAAQPCG